MPDQRKRKKEKSLLPNSNKDDDKNLICLGFALGEEKRGKESSDFVTGDRRTSEQVGDLVLSKVKPAGS